MLPIFNDKINLPENDEEIMTTLNSPLIRKINCFTLGPKGTNIEQACTKWIIRFNLIDKSEKIYCSTPEESVIKARAIKKNDEIGIFWTCAVYYREREIFFSNPDAYPFFTQETMKLDEMQLAINPEHNSLQSIEDINKKTTIASHPSPLILLKTLQCKPVRVNSNSEAALFCFLGSVDACITTEKARIQHDLKNIHSFGCPKMIFLGGVAGNSATIVDRVYKDMYLHKRNQIIA